MADSNNHRPPVDSTPQLFTDSVPVGVVGDALTVIGSLLPYADVAEQDLQDRLKSAVGSEAVTLQHQLTTLRAQVSSAKLFMTIHRPFSKETER